MNPTTTVVLIAIVVTAGRWSENKTMSIQTVIGVAVLAIALSVMAEANSELGKGFALLILVTVLLRYTISITSKLGLK